MVRFTVSPKIWKFKKDSNQRELFNMRKANINLLRKVGLFVLFVPVRSSNPQHPLL